MCTQDMLQALLADYSANQQYHDTSKSKTHFTRVPYCWQLYSAVSHWLFKGLSQCLFEHPITGELFSLSPPQAFLFNIVFRCWERFHFMQKSSNIWGQQPGGKHLHLFWFPRKMEALMLGCAIGCTVSDQVWRLHSLSPKHRFPAAGRAVVLLMTKLGLYSLTVILLALMPDCRPVVNHHISGELWGLDSCLCVHDSAPQSLWQPFERLPASLLLISTL